MCSVLNHLENRRSCTRTLFVDCSSSFNSMILNILTTKLDHLQIPQLASVRLPPPRRRAVSSSPHCSPCLHMTAHQSTQPTSSSSRLLEPSWLGSSLTEMTHRTGSGRELTRWSSENNLMLNVLETNELIMDLLRVLTKNN